jgi:hypothetical protein
MRLHSAESVAHAAKSAYCLWVPLAEASRVRLPAPWISGFPVDKVNGEDAVLFKHPPRERAVARYLNGDRLSLAEAAYVVQCGLAS